VTGNVSECLSRASSFSQQQLTNELRLPLTKKLRQYNMEAKTLSIENLSLMVVDDVDERTSSIDSEFESYDSSELSDDSITGEIEQEMRQGLFLSSAMHNLLRGSVGSDSDLPAMAIAQDPTIKKLVRRGSDSGVNVPESKVTYVIQTKSATKCHDSNEPKPCEVLKKILTEHGAPTETRSTLSLENFWVPWNTSGFTIELTDAIRTNNLPPIRRMHESNHNLQCSNKFGESIVHTAARRGSLDVLEYLIHMADVSVRVCCDNGRTPLHDACWTDRPNFDCVRFLLRQCPDFLLLTDKRGWSPLEYAPRDTWGEWNTFLKENSALFLPVKET
jgi:hypothetical protein